MSQQRFRAPQGGRIDRSKPLRFRFDGRELEGYAGDTLASALLANGVRLVGRSFKYHRPRGIYSAGVEEPNAIVQLRSGPRTEPNMRAPQIDLYDGLEAESQNRWPSLAFDVGAVNQWFQRLMPSGFYYKTFMGPRWLGNAPWMFFERIIRHAAGLGRAPTLPDPDHYEKRFAHCDVLVVGAGPAGIAAAFAAGRSGARVMLVDESPLAGGTLRADCGDAVHAAIGASPALEWVRTKMRDLAGMDNVRVLRRASAFGYYDQNLVTVCERLHDDAPQPPAHQPRQRVWWVRAQQVVLATGAIERPIVFEGNDLPGVMLAGAARRFANEQAVAAGRRALVFTNNDSAYVGLPALRAVGCHVAAVVDARADGPGEAARRIAEEAGAELLTGSAVVRAVGGMGVESAQVMRYDVASGAVSGTPRGIPCDLLCVSGGWNPTVHLFSQSQGRTRYDESIASFVPGESRQAERSAGAAAGSFTLAAALGEGGAAGAEAARAVGFKAKVPRFAKVEEAASAPLVPVWEIPFAPGRHGKRFVDLQDDVTSEDVRLANREGYVSVEHLKRYTTLGMGTDQGRTSNVNGLAIMSSLLGKSVPEVGHTTFRAPFSPVTMGAIAAAEHGRHVAPIRRTPMYDWHRRAGAPFVTAGPWLRAQYYPRPGETMMQSIWREAKHVRNHVGIVDVSPLGKIEVQGRDAAEFLERVYINRWKKLAVGRARYGLMLREDGVVLDDGTTTRIAENEFYMTTTTAKAGQVMAQLEFYAQTVWPQLHVHLTSITDQWGGLALAGPHARTVLKTAVGDSCDVSNEALPFMGYAEAEIAGCPVRLFRITFSGELAYEIHMPADFGETVWQAVIDAGEPHDIIPYGTEAMSILRIEKGHLVGGELDGRSYPAEFGFGRMLKPDGDYIGKRSLEREALAGGTGRRFVGLVSENGKHIPRGAQLVWNPTAPKPVQMLGHVTSTCYSPNLDREIALAMLRDGDHRMGESLYASSPVQGQHVPVKVVEPVFIDPQGERPRA